MAKPMARPIRIECADTFYHVMSRGNERRDIFRDRRDYKRFCELLEVLCERFKVEIWSYVLMSNHYHLIVKTKQANLSRAIQWLGVSYASWFNVRHDRIGHLFEGRFKSFVVEDDAYLKQLLLYVHRNPLRAEIVERLVDYEWSSYRCLAYGRGCVGWLERESVLDLFGNDQRVFRREIQHYSEEKESLFENLRHGVFLGSRDGLVSFLHKIENIKPHRKKPQTRALAGAESVEELVMKLAKALGLSESELEELRYPKRHVRRSMRDALIYAVWERGDFRLSEIGTYFNVGYTAIGNARVRGEAYLKRNRAIRKKIESL